MARDQNWTQAEVDATVAAYFQMLRMEVASEPFVKAHHLRRLLAKLPRRNKHAVEKKHHNITAILAELGHPGIEGYKPFGNYQQRLWDTVVARLDEDAGLAELLMRRTLANAYHAVDHECEHCEEAPPTPDPDATKRARRRPPTRQPRRNVNYLEIEARNRELGHLGEMWVLEREEVRLRKAGKKALAGRIEHVAESRGDGLGYDILSFETSGKKRFVEVKTTTWGKNEPFFTSINEVETSRELEAQYFLYRVYRFNKNRRFYKLGGALDTAFILDPVQFRSRGPRPTPPSPR